MLLPFGESKTGSLSAGSNFTLKVALPFVAFPLHLYFIRDLSLLQLVTILPFFFVFFFFDEKEAAIHGEFHSFISSLAPRPSRKRRSKFSR